MGQIIHIDKARFAPIGRGNGLTGITLTLSEGEAWAVQTDLPDDGHLFMRGVATLNAPREGAYFYRGVRLHFSDHRKLLFYKRKMAYIAPDSALIGNRTIEENILLMRSYFEDGPVKIEGEALELCRLFRLENKLMLRPGQLDREDLRLAVIVRELSKSPEVLLIERPRDSLGPEAFSLLEGVLAERSRKGIPIIFLSADEAFTGRLATGLLRIRGGLLQQNGVPPLAAEPPGP